MTRVVLDAQLRSRLMDLTQSLDFCDESGRVLGTYRPLAPARHGYVEQPLSAEEWQRRELGPGHSTQEVIDYLEKL